MKVNQRQQGSKYEQAAADFLKSEGMFIKELNFYCKIGEIDIVAEDENYLVFVEVKYRKDVRNGHAVEAVNPGKIKKICRTADYYMMINNYGSDKNVRFDVVAIEEGHLKHYKNAFDYVL